MKKYFCLLCFCCSYLMCFEVSAQLDTNYIEKNSNTFLIGLLTRNNNYSGRINHLNDQSISFGRNSISTGFRLRYKSLVAVAILPIYSQEKQNYNIKPAHLGIALRPVIGPVYIQLEASYVSFLRNLVFTPIDFRESLRNDIGLYHAEIEAIYVLNYKKISLACSYNFLHRQIKSAGSPVISGIFDFSSQKMTEDERVKLNITNFDLEFYRRQFYGLGGGYTYSYVYKNLILNGLITGGLAYTNYVYKDINSDIQKNKKLEIYPQVRTRASISYFKNDYYLGLVGEYFSKSLAIEQLGVHIRDNNLRLEFGRAF